MLTCVWTKTFNINYATAFSGSNYLCCTNTCTLMKVAEAIGCCLDFCRCWPALQNTSSTSQVIISHYQTRSLKLFTFLQGPFALFMPFTAQFKSSNSGRTFYRKRLRLLPLPKFRAKWGAKIGSGLLSSICVSFPPWPQLPSIVLRALRD